MSLVTIKSSHYESDLLVLKSRLEAEGIPCFLKNEFSTQMLSHIPASEVELQIMDEDIDKARDFIPKEEIN